MRVEIVQHLACPGRSVVIDGIPPQFARIVVAVSALRDVEPLPVPRDQNAVRTRRVVRDTGYRPRVVTLRIQPVHRSVVKLQISRFVAVPRVGEPQPCPVHRRRGRSDC